MDAQVIAVACDGAHRFSKPSREAITLVAGLGVVGDAHAGVTVQHLSRVRQDPAQPNLRQVHLIHAELFDELAAKGLAITPGDMGENITTRGIDLLKLSAGTMLRIGGAVIQVTGLRNPCRQLDRFAPGLMAATLAKAADGTLIRKAGVMAIVTIGGEVCPGGTIAIVSVPERHRSLGPV